MKYGFLFCVLVSFLCCTITAQEDTTRGLTFSAYAEVYYNYDAGNPENHERPFFIYNHKRHNEVNVNFVMAKVAYVKSNVRANAAVMFGNYVQYNLAAEPAMLRNIYEANIGFRLSKKKYLWLDAGIMPSHIGFENVIGSDCWTLSRSLCAENSPYYESGIRVSYFSDNKKWNMALFALNGWQHMQRPDGYNKPSFGAQLQYKPNSKLIFNWSNFTGSDKPDSLNTLRIFNNLYAQYEAGKFGFIAGFDAGYDKKDSLRYGFWYSPVLILRYNLNTKWTIAARSEYFNDTEQILVATGSPHGFQVMGNSLNLDYKVNQNALIRIEAKQYNATDKLFVSDSKPDYNNYCFTASFCIKF